MTGPSQPTARPRRWGRIVAVALALVCAIVAALLPWWGRQLAFFNVIEVEVRGARYTTPQEVVDRLKIDTTFSIWNPMDSVEARVLRHPQIREVTIRRRLPSKLILEIVESEPIAYVTQRNGVRAYDAAGRALTFDPSRVFADLPIVSKPDSVVFSLLGDLKAGFPDIFARVSEVQILNADQIRIRMLSVPVLAMRDVSADRFLELSSVEADLARRNVRAVELDLRYKDQVIARLP